MWVSTLIEVTLLVSGIGLLLKVWTDYLKWRRRTQVVPVSVLWFSAFALLLVITGAWGLFRR